MSKLTPEMVTCPACGRRFTNRGYQNHVNKCPKMAGVEKETMRRIRHMPKSK